LGTVAQRDLYKMINDATARGERVVALRSRARAAQLRSSVARRCCFSKMTEVAGTVGGGCIEAEVGRRRVTPGVQANPRCINFSLTAEESKRRRNGMRRHYGYSLSMFGIHKTASALRASIVPAA